ncbi:MAG: nicotinate phosphoribosyltransferase [Ideonella sp.]|nr:nicotinate phosphoribosyltransferase [Ideonella sp.]MCC7456102.1 nicotinate phosphoribosyltransferase [Nitrospira sp.]
MTEPFKPAISTLLDTDLYKFSMWQVMLHHNPEATGLTQFICRNTPQVPLADLVDDVREQLEWLCSLRFTERDLAVLGERSFFKRDFLEWLGIFRFQMKFLEVATEGEHLKIVARGPLVHITGFEVFVLSIVNELYFRRLATPAVLAEGRRRLQAKIEHLRRLTADPAHARRHPYVFFDFGTRRRFSGAWHDEVLAALLRGLPDHFRGTSNVERAHQHGLVPIGTMGHEHLQKHQGLGHVQLRRSVRAALEEWVQEYRGDLGIALTDVITTDAFLRDFDLYYAKLFDGMRHDSGDPDAWARKILDHYQRLRIDPHTKRLVFSNALTFDESFRLYLNWGDAAQYGAGIGTWLTNDLGPTPLNIVMKLREVNHQPVAKLSDDPGKALEADPVFLAYLKQVFGVQ